MTIVGDFLLASTALPLAGWGLHALWLRRQLDRARRDPLTGLHTRAVFERTATRMLRHAPHAVLVIDLDGFKALNDTHGHAAGDEAIRATGTRLHQTITPYGGLAARLGGDEFTALLPAADPATVPYVLRDLHDALTAPLAHQGKRLPLGASIGACWTGELPAPDLTLALRRADEAMYVAKRGGGGWLTSDGSTPTHHTVNGRRAGRPGTHHHGGAA